MRTIFSLSRSTAFVAAFLLTIPASAQLVERRTTDSGNETVRNWEDGYFEVTGYGTADYEPNRIKMRLKALTVAKVLAQREMVELLQGVKIKGATEVRDLVLARSITTAVVEGTSQGAVTVAQEITWEPLEDGREVPQAAVTLRVCVRDRSPACTQYGGGQGLMRSMRLATVEIPEEEPVETYEPSREELQDAREVLDEEEPAELYNSLILRTNGQFYQPVLYPEVITEDGHGVYGREQIDSTALLTNGPAQFTNNVDQAKTIELIASEPLIVIIAQVDEQQRLVISAEDAAKIAAANAKNGDFLRSAKVAIVLD